MNNIKVKILAGTLSLGMAFGGIVPSFADTNSGGYQVKEQELTKKEGVANSVIKNYNYLKKPNFSTKFFKNQSQIKNYVTEYIFATQEHDRFYAMPETDLTDLAVKLQNDSNLNTRVTRYNISKVLFELSDLSAMYINDNDDVDNHVLSVSYRYVPSTGKLTNVTATKSSREEVNRISQSKPGSKSLILANKSQYLEASRKADQIVASIPKDIRSNDALVAKYLVDWITKNNVYDHDNRYNVHNNYYGALIKGVSKCDGFTQAFNMLCRRAGIPAYRIIGNFRGIDNYTSHAWSMIFIQGEWVLVDPTTSVGRRDSYPESAFAGTYRNGYYKDYKADDPYVNTMNQVVGFTPYNYKDNLRYTSKNTTEAVERFVEVDKTKLRAKYNDIQNALNKGYDFLFDESTVKEKLAEAKKVLDNKYARELDVSKQLETLDVYGEYSVVSRRALYNSIMDVKWALYKGYNFEYDNSLVVLFLNDSIKTYNNKYASKEEIKSAISSIDIFCKYDAPAKIKISREKAALRNRINEIKNALNKRYKFVYSRSLVINITNQAIRVYNNPNSTNKDFERELKSLELFCEYSKVKNDEIVTDNNLEQSDDNSKAESNESDHSEGVVKKESASNFNDEVNISDDKEQDVDNSSSTDNEDELATNSEESSTETHNNSKDLSIYEHSKVSVDEIRDMLYNIDIKGIKENKNYLFANSLVEKDNIEQEELDKAYIKLILLDLENSNSIITEEELLTKIDNFKVSLDEEINLSYEIAYINEKLSEFEKVLESENYANYSLEEINEYINLLSRKK